MPTIYCLKYRPILTIVLAFLLPASSDAQTVDAVRDAYADVDRRLTAGGRASEWREYLLLDQLSGQMRKGLEADRAAVAHIHARFVRGSEVYLHDELTAARDAIHLWLRDIDAPTLEQLPRLARKSAGNLNRPSAAELHEQRVITRDLIESLHARLPHSESHDKWRTFFGIPHAPAQLRDGAKINPKLFEMIAQRHAASTRILKNANLAHSAAALSKTAKMFRAADIDDRALRRQIGKLADALESHARQPTNAKPKKIVEVLSWLDDRSQLAPLVVATRRHFYQPNLFVRASKRLVGAGIDRTINEPLEIDEMILGNRYTGAGRVRGTVRLEFVPDVRRLSMRLNSTTTVASYTSTSQGSVSIDSQSTVKVRARKGVLFDQFGRTLLPSSVQARSSSDIVNISTQGRLLGRRIAERRAYAQKAANDEAAGQQTRDRVRTKIDEGIAKLIDPIEKFYLRYIRLPLLIRGNFPHTIRTRTTTDFVDVSLAQANAKQWSLTQTPLPLDEQFDLSIRMHESFVDNLAAGLWPGTTVSESRVQDELEKLFGRSPEGLKVADPKRVWTVTFDEQQPLKAKFDDSTLTLSLRAAGFTLGDKSYPGMWITARYAIVPGAKGFAARREGRLEIVPPGFDPNGGDKLGVRQQVLRSMLRKRFERVFPAQWTIDPIQLTGPWKKAGKLEVADLAAQRGWLMIGFRLPAR